MLPTYATDEEIIEFVRHHPQRRPITHVPLSDATGNAIATVSFLHRDPSVISRKRVLDLLSERKKDEGDE
jgi:hypothetical protein